MSLSSESDFLDYKKIIVNGLRSTEKGLCVDLLVVYKELDTNGNPGMHLCVPINHAKDLACAMIHKVIEGEEQLDADWT